MILILPKEGEILNIINEFKLEYKINYFRSWVNNKGTNYPRAIVSTLINVFQLFTLGLKLRKENIKPDLIYSNTLGKKYASGELHFKRKKQVGLWM